MAAELQSWVFDTGQAALQSRRGRAYLRGEDYVFTMTVSDVRGEDPIFVEGAPGDGDGAVEAGGVVLVSGQGKGTGGQEGVKVGDVVGIRAPTWEIEVMGRQWHVGVDWKVIR